MILFQFLLLANIFVNATSNSIYPVRVALAVDEGSVNDALMLMRSILETALNYENIFFHLVSCGKTVQESELFSVKLSQYVTECMLGVNFEVKSFSLPVNSGFLIQAQKNKNKRHWASSTGADMARFYLPTLFKQYDRILYLDNDIIVSCCLEEMWATDLSSNQVVGIVLDHCPWTVGQQFSRHYNATHPIVIQSIRKNSSASLIPLTKEEFHKAVPEYPNDGVILFNIPKYNELDMLGLAERIALVNAVEHIVSVGSQQFTTLLFHDKWKGLSQRFNLRHMPHIAKGFLMYFQYHGFIHYAGSNKPNTLCYQRSVNNVNRYYSYTPWATTRFLLNQTCPNSLPLQHTVTCANDVPNVSSFSSFLALIRAVSQIYPGTNGLHLYFNTATKRNPGVRVTETAQLLASNLSWSFMNVSLALERSLFNKADLGPSTRNAGGRITPTTIQLSSGPYVTAPSVSMDLCESYLGRTWDPVSLYMSLESYYNFTLYLPPYRSHLKCQMLPEYFQAKKLDVSEAYLMTFDLHCSITVTDPSPPSPAAARHNCLDLLTFIHSNSLITFRPKLIYVSITLAPTISPTPSPSLLTSCVDLLQLYLSSDIARWMVRGGFIVHDLGQGPLHHADRRRDSLQGYRKDSYGYMNTAVNTTWFEIDRCDREALQSGLRIRSSATAAAAVEGYRQVVLWGTRVNALELSNVNKRG